MNKQHEQDNVVNKPCVKPKRKGRASIRAKVTAISYWASKTSFNDYLHADNKVWRHIAIRFPDLPFRDREAIYIVTAGLAKPYWDK